MICIINERLSSVNGGVELKGVDKKLSKIQTVIAMDIYCHTSRDVFYRRNEGWEC
jgi:hypothetical protein